MKKKKSKLKEIGEGWLNVLIKDCKVEEEAQRRMAICNECPIKLDMMGVFVCGDCHCPLIAKTRSPESTCPLNKW